VLGHKKTSMTKNLSRRDQSSIAIIPKSNVRLETAVIFLKSSRVSG
jgi:hypothetical protein